MCTKIPLSSYSLFIRGKLQRSFFLHNSLFFSSFLRFSLIWFSVTHFYSVIRSVQGNEHTNVTLDSITSFTHMYAILYILTFEGEKGIQLIKVSLFFPQFRLTFLTTLKLIYEICGPPKPRAVSD